MLLMIAPEEFDLMTAYHNKSYGNKWHDRKKANINEFCEIRNLNFRLHASNYCRRISRRAVAGMIKWGHGKKRACPFSIYSHPPIFVWYILCERNSSRPYAEKNKMMESLNTKRVGFWCFANKRLGLLNLPEGINNWKQVEERSLV